jgi:hypothetical protein
MKVPGKRTALVLLFAVAAAPASADGTLGLGEVLIAVSKAPKLVAEIKAELDKDGLEVPSVTCIAARHGNHWKYLGGGRAAPYRCELGKRTVSIEADRVYFDERGHFLGHLDKVDPRHAKTFKEDNFRWTWTP